MKKLIILASIVLFGAGSYGQVLTMKNPYSGTHYAFSRFKPGELNRFVVGFNKMWADDISTGFHQYSGNELGQTFTTSGMRFVWGKKDMQWTISTDYALGFGKDKNSAKFRNGIEQRMELRYTCNQINNAFGVAFKENTVWLEALYCTNLGRVFIEYSTIHQTGLESFGPEYKLNGLYKGLIRTTELGIQTSYRWGRMVFYGRVLFPIAIMGPAKEERGLIDQQSVQADPRDFPSNYETYVNDPAGHIERNEGLHTDSFKGLSYGFGTLLYLGNVSGEKKDKKKKENKED